ncbi:MAG: hypothetical protein WA991_14835 [Ornithinimicrobium sp.]
MAAGDGEGTGGGLIGWFDRHHSGVTALAALSVPVLTAGAGYWVASTASDRQTQAQYVNVASSILSEDLADEEEVPEEQRALREYAVELLAHSSPVAIEDDVRQALVDGTITLDTSALLKNFGSGSSGQIRASFLAAAESTEIPAPEGCTATVGSDVFEYDLVAEPVPQGTYEVERIRTLTFSSGETHDGYLLAGIEGWVLSRDDAISASDSCP